MLPLLSLAVYPGVLNLFSLNSPKLRPLLLMKLFLCSVPPPPPVCCTSQYESQKTDPSQEDGSNWEKSNGVKKKERK